MQWNGPHDGSVRDLAEWCGFGTIPADHTIQPSGQWNSPTWLLLVWIEKSESQCLIEAGDWLIREADGNGVYPCKGYIFADRYEAVA